MDHRAPPEIEFRWLGGSLRAVGVPALFVVAVLGTGYLMLVNWERIFG
jgi:hypothetical protein